MKIRTFTLTVAAALFVAGSAFAQPNGAGRNDLSSGNGSGPDMEMQTGSISNDGYQSDVERIVYQNGDIFRPFFTDDSMAALKSETEIRQTYRRMDSQSQAELTKTCDSADAQRGSYGTMTYALCSIFGVM